MAAGRERTLQRRSSWALMLVAFSLQSLIGPGNCNMFGSGSGMLMPLSDLYVDYNATSSEVSISWTDSGNTTDFLLNYTALVDTITLEEVSIMLSATEYVLGGQFVQSGVTIELTVQARDAMGELCDPLMDMFDIPGVFSPSPATFSATALSATSVQLNWTVSFPQVSPGTFSLSYDINKLTGNAASPTTGSLSLNLSQAETSNVSEFSYLLESLLSYTEYTFSLSSNYAGNASDVIMASSTTDEDMPGPVANLAATIVATTSTDTHNITISFEPPPEPNGVVIQYSYAISDTQTTQTVASGMVTMTSIEEISTQIEPYTNYTVSVAAMNPAGVGEESSVTVVSPQAAPGPVENLTASFNTTGATFNTTSRMYTLDISTMWDEPTNPNGVITSYNVTVYQTDDPNDIIFSDSAVTATTVTESVMALPYTNYTVVVTASTSAGEGEEESVIDTSPQAAPGPVENLTASFDDAVTVASFNTTSRMYTLDISIMWDEPTNPNGVITSYNVTVYQTDGSNDVIFSDIAVTATTVTESVMALPYTNYTVAVTASTSAGEGEEESVIETSPQAAPGPVENLTASFDDAVTVASFNTTSRMYTLDISIMWDEPTNPNGVITSYNVTVYQTDGSNDVIFSDIAVTATTVTESVMALPYTNYTVAVTASTSAGEGEEESVIETSPQAAPGLVENLTASFDDAVTVASFNTTSRMYTLDISIMWDEPTNPNGVITSHNVTVYQTDGPNDVIFSDIAVTATTVTESVMALPYTNYTVAVTASTSAGEGVTSTITTLSPQAAPGPVESLIASFNTTGSTFNTTSRMYTLDISIMWDEPTNPNGVITSHNVTVYKTDDPNDVIFSDIAVTATTVTESVMALPYTNYTVAVTASTSAGEGEEESVIETSPQAAPGPVESLTASFDTTGSTFNTTSRMYTLDISIMWGEPTNPNGVITSYNVTVYQTDDPNDVIFSDSAVTATTVTESVMALPYTDYTVAVTASTSAGEGEEESVIDTSPQAAPSVPLDLTVTGTTVSTVSLQWSEPELANGIITNYIIQFYQPSNPSAVTFFSNSSVATSITVDGLDAFTQYTFSVAAMTVERGPFAEINATTTESVPGPVEGLTASFDTTGSTFNTTSRMYTLDISIMWGEPTNPNGVITSYNVTVYQTDGSNDVIFSDSAVTATTVTESVMALPYTNYTVAVTASTSAGEGEEESVIETSPQAAPSPVESLSAEFNSTAITFNTTSQMYTLPLTISFSPPSFRNGVLTNYSISVVDTDTDSMTVYTTTPSATTSGEEVSVTSDVSVLAHVNYTVSVQAFTIAGGGETVEVIILSPQAGPSEPLDVSATAINSTAVNVTWSEPEYLNGVLESYSVTVTSLSLDPEQVQMVSLGPGELNAVVGSLTPFTEYSVVVVGATEGGGEGEVSDPVTVTTLEAAPSVVLNLTVSYNGTHVLVSWLEPAEPNGNLQYNVTITGLDLNRAVSVLSVSDIVTEVQYTLEVDVEPYAEYTVTVFAETGGGEGEAATDSFTTDEGESTAPHNFEVTDITNTSATFSWDSPLDANGIVTSYTVTLNASGVADLSMIITNLTEPLEVSFVDLPPFVDHTATIFATNGFGDGVSTSLHFTTLTGIPTAPTLITVATNNEPGNLTATWSAPSMPNGEITSYTVMVTSDETMLMEGITGTESVLTELLAYTDYSVSVQACTSAGCGPFSNEITNRTEQEAPSAPRTVSAVALTSDSIQVAWSTPDPTNGIITNYRVTYFPTSDTAAMQTATTDGDTTELNITGLTPFTNYTVYVEGVTVETGDMSESVTVVTLEDAPTEPTNVEATAQNATAITVEWEEPVTANGIIRGYNITYNQTGSDVINVDAATRSVTIGGLMPFTYYEFVVTAFTIEMGPGDSATAMTLQAAPSVPLNLMVTGTTVSTVSLQWSEPGLANGIITNYIIQFYQPSDPSAVTVFSNSSVATTITVDGLDAFTQYTFRVAAMTVERGPFAEINATTTESVPSAPLNVAARNSSSTSIIIEWSAPATPRGTITSYTITYYITADEAGSSSTMVVSDGGAVSAEIEGLSEFTNYTVSVQASTSAGIGDSSDLVTVFTDEDVPSAPLDLQVFVINSTLINITWSQPADANGILLRYNVYLEEEADGQLLINEKFVVSAIPEMSSYSLLIPDLAAFTLYGIQVAAETRVGEGERTAVVFVTTDPDSASPPTFVEVQVLNSTAVELSWSYPEIPRGNITGYIIYHNASSEGNNQVNLTLPSMNDMSNQSHVFGQLSPFTYYGFRVGAFTVTLEQTHFGTPSEPPVVERTDEDLPSMPMNFNLERLANQPTQLSASWSEPLPANGIITAYTLTCSLSPQQFYPEQSNTEPSSIVTTVQDGSTTSATVEGLVPFTNYACFMTANTSVGEGDSSSTETQRTDESVPSDEPQNFRVTAVESQSIELQWDRPTTPNGFIVSYDIQYMDRGSLVTMSLDNATFTYNASELNEYTDHTFNITALTRVGPGPVAMVEQRTAEDVPSAPVQSLSGVNSSSTSLTISWQPPPADDQNGIIRAYNVSYGLPAQETSSYTTESTPNEMIELTGLEKFTEYLVIVNAFTVGPGPLQNITVQTDSDFPSQPVDVSYANLSSSSVRLTWQPPAQPNGDILSYSVNYSGPAEFGGASETRSIPDISNTMVDILGLVPYTEYSVVVFAFTDKGRGSASDQLTVLTDQDVPSAPGGLTLVTVTDDPTQLSASWSEPLPANGIITAYTLTCSLSPQQFYPEQSNTEPSSIVTIVQDGSTTSATVEGLVQFTNYDCFVTANTSVGEGDSSSTETQRTDESVPSDEPQNFRVTAVESQSIELQWDRPTTPNGFIVSYDIQYMDRGSLVTMSLDNATFTYDASELNEYTNHTFNITALTRVGAGPMAMVEQRTAEDVPSAPVQSLSGVNSSSTSLTISWQPPPADDQNGIIRAYNVSYGLPEETSSYTNESTPNEMIELTGLEKFTEYLVIVNAFTVGPGPSASVTVRTDSDLPSKPLNLMYENITADSIRVYWDPPAESNGVLESYRLMYTEVITNTTSVITDIEPQNTLVTPLMEYEMYIVRVAASTDKGFGAYSDPLDVLTAEHAPDAPENFAVTDINSTSLQATWEEPLDSNGIILGYSLDIRLTPSQEYLPSPVPTSYPDLDPGQFELVITELHPFARYELVLRAITSFGLGNATFSMNTTSEAAPSQGVQNVSAPVLSPYVVDLMWLPPQLENWNGILTSYTIDIAAVDDFQQRTQLENFPDTPRNETLTSLEFMTPANPNEALGGIQLESVTVGDLQEYQSYVFTVTVRNSLGEGTPMTVCSRTEEAAPTGSPTILSFTITSNTTAELSWQPPPPLDQNGVIVDYTILLYDSRSGQISSRNTESNGTFYVFENLTPFTEYTVSVAALTSQGTGPHSSNETNTTFEGLPTMPQNLEVTDFNYENITLAWMPPAIPYGNVDLYRVRYQGFKNTENISDVLMMSTTMLSIILTGLTGDTQYFINVSARTGAGYGEVRTTTVDLPNGPPPEDVIDPDEDPEVVPQPVVDDETGDDGVTDNSAIVAFTLPGAINNNGPVDTVLIYVQRMPSTNAEKGTWYTSNKATDNWPQYAAIEMKVGSRKRKKRATGDIEIQASIGNEALQCGPSDTVCNGPLDSSAEYGVRYTLFSGNQSQEYPFFSGAGFRTDAAPSEGSSGVGAVVGGVLGGLVFIGVLAIVIALVAYFLMGARRKGTIDLTSRTSARTRNHNKPLLPHKNGSTNKPAPFLGPSDPGIVPLGEIKNASFSNPRSPAIKANSRRLMLKDLGEAVRGMLDDAGYIFSEEYERVTEVGLEHSKEASLMGENRAKNRYTNILAYDHSRVKLSYVDDEPGSDYINASYIPGYRMRRAYIATQGPLPATFDDFWRMVWEQNTHTIVMLTQLVERGRTKCHRYWPGIECIVYGEIAVEMVSENEKEDWTVREFRLSMEKKSRTVWHYQFTSWPDHGVPDTPTAAIDFVRTVRDSVLMNHGPLVVHCSAGVGRTGCFISLDTLLQHIEEHDYIDIYALASEMRQHRNHMIQTEAQYVFVHKAMVEYIEANYSGKSPTRFSAFPSLYTNQYTDDSTQMSDYYGDFLSEETHM